MMLFKPMLHFIFILVNDYGFGNTSITLVARTSY